jgi:hypothetical protein
MGKIVKVTCDGCGHDLTTRSNSVDYRLVLAAESKPGCGAGAYTDMMIYPPVDRTYYFCGLECLDHWRGRSNHRSALWRQQHEKWIDERGTRKGVNGALYTSYPEMPEEMRERLNAEFEAAALVAFPMKNALAG